MSCSKSWDVYIAENYPWLLAQDEDGNWITLDNGRHIFIEEGESLDRALQRHKIPFKTNIRLNAEINDRVDKLLKSKGFSGIGRHTIPRNSTVAMQIRFSENDLSKPSFGINPNTFKLLNEDVGSEDTRTVYNFSAYHELAHLEQMKEDPEMPKNYGSSKLAARHYENDANYRAEKMTGIKKKEVDDIIAKAVKIRITKMAAEALGSQKKETEEKPRMKRETKTPYDNFLEDCIVVDGKREITKKEEDGETSSPVPAEWVQEIQRALDGWRDAVFIQDVVGVLRDKSTQKISKQE